MSKYVMQALKAVAFDSPDHVAPRGTKNDNSRNPLFNRKFEGLFPGRRLALLDLGCAGGGFVKDCLDNGHHAAGVEGSDYSKKIKRAEWATIPDHLFTADITVKFQLFESGADGQKAARFDMITGWELLEHLREEDLPGFVENLRRHMNPNCLCVFSIADFPDEADGVVYHQSVHPHAWWVEKFASLGFQDHPELVKYFDPDWIRGPLQGSQSFHVVLSLHGASVPSIPNEKPYTVDDLIANGRLFLNQGLNYREDGGKALAYSIRCLNEAELTSKNPLLPHLRAVSLMALGDLNRAGQAVVQSLKLDSDFGPARRFASILGITAPQLKGAQSMAIMPPADCLLTLLFGARNDAYMGDFSYRFSTCINYLARNLRAIGRLNDVEILVVDWNSDTPLHTVLPLSHDAREIVRFITVPPDIARPIQLDSPFPISIVQNVAVRRARGQFIGQTDSDILFTQASLRSLFQILDGKISEVTLKNSLLVASRRHMPYQQVLRKPSLESMDAYLSRNASIFPREDFFPGFATPSALALCHRDVWQSCRGYDERLIYWGWMEINLYLRLTQRMPWFDIAAFGVNLIHIEHFVSPRGSAPQPHRKTNPTLTSIAYEANDENWGLADQPLDKVSGADQPSIDTQTSIGSEIGSDTIDSITASIIGSANQKFVTDFAKTAQLSTEQASVLFPLAWYARERFPRIYVDIGARYAATACIAAAACPGVEIYAIDSWQSAGSAANSQIWAASKAISQFGRKQNYTRFITGEPSTAIERLFTSPTALQGIDLALLRTAPMFGDPNKNALYLANHLNPGGAIVVSTRVDTEFERVWTTLQAKYSNWLYVRLQSRSGETRNGLILAM